MRTGKNMQIIIDSWRARRTLQVNQRLSGNKVIKWLAAACLLAGAAASVVAQSPTQEEIRRFQRLTPEQRAAIMKAVDQQQQNKVDEQPLEAPRLVMPMESREDRRTGSALDDRRKGSTSDAGRNEDRRSGSARMPEVTETGAAAVLQIPGVTETDVRATWSMSGLTR